MSAAEFDPELLQIKWVLGGLRPEDLPDQAAVALEHGFDGTALRQLAGLHRPTLQDLDSLPKKAFQEMGLGAIDKKQAATALIARGLPRVSDAISELLKAFPGFGERWQKHVANWSGESAGSYNDMEQFVDFVIDDLYGNGDREELRRFFYTLEGIVARADAETRNLIALGFFERLQNAARLPDRGKAFEEFLGPKSTQMWNELLARWAG
jgi:hypothetical protein